QRCLDPDPKVARAAIFILRFMGFDEFEKFTEPYFALVPTDPHADLPESLKKLSTPMIEAIFINLDYQERFKDEKEAPNKKAYPSYGKATPKSERLASELLTRAEAGESVSLRTLSGYLKDQNQRSTDGDTLLPDYAVAIVAARLEKVEFEK